jgi:spore maturation protein A
LNLNRLFEVKLIIIKGWDFMLNYIWFGMLVFGFITALFNGRIDAASKAAIDSAGKAVELSIGLLGIMCLWTGLMRIAEKSGLVRYIARAVKPVLRFLFPEIPNNHPAMGGVVMNLVANFFGLGNAATPLGLKAMNELQKLNPRKETATKAMSMFLVLNTSSIQLIPATVIAIRSASGSLNPAEVIGPIWVASACACAVGVAAAKFFGSFYKDEKL